MTSLSRSARYRRSSALWAAGLVAALATAMLAAAPDAVHAAPSTPATDLPAETPAERIAADVPANGSAALPTALVDALHRDLDISPEDYEDRTAAAVDAVDAVQSLEESGVEVLGARLDGTRLVVNVDSEADAQAVRGAGGVAEFGAPVTPDYAGLVLQPLADLVGGQGYTFATLSGSQRVNHSCSVSFTGRSASTGQSQFLTAGHCLETGRQDGGSFFEARQTGAGSLVTRGPVIGTPIESAFRFGSGVDAGLVATAPGWNPRPLVSTWGGSNLGVTQGTPVPITQASPGIVGAPICKSGRTTGWTCGEILALNYPTPVYNEQSGTPVIVNLTLTSVCMLDGDSGSAGVIGNAAFGVGTAGSWETSCNRAAQPDAISAFFPLLTTDGSASVASAFPDWQLLTGSPYGNDWSPLGSFDNASASLKTTRLSGWGFDPDASGSVQIHVYVGGGYAVGEWGGAYTANAVRTDVGAAYPGAGDNRGFAIDLRTRSGTTKYCLYAINTGLGSTTDLGCRTASAPTGPPIGNVESAKLDGTRVALTGWAIDPDVAASISVHVYVNGAWGGEYKADAARTDVGAAYRDYGNAHGFSIPSLSVPVGTSRICVYGIDSKGPVNTELGCRTVSTASGPPRGSIDKSAGSIGAITLSGWALDPDTPAPVAVHVYVDGAWAGQYTADTARPDVASAFPGYGDKHGFSLTIPQSGGKKSVCVYGINAGPAETNALIACTSVTVPGGDPIGNLESVTVSGGTATVQGWAIDPDTAGAVTVHFYVSGGWGGQAKADAVRNDVGRAYPAYGPAHGFRSSIATPSAGSRICAYALNVGTGSKNTELGCIVVR